jgi:hypothetical protein
MAFNESEIGKIEKAVATFLERRRPPLHIRAKLDLGYRISGQSLELFEIRPMWKDPTKKTEAAVAKATYVRRANLWKVYWQRADLAWHAYEPEPVVKSVAQFLSLVDADEYAAFFG